MVAKEQEHDSITPSDQALVLSSLEREQLAGLKKHLIPRRRLAGPEKFLIWSLRVYLFFMMVVVVYQVWVGLH
ncbi:MAG: hypothetical protein ABSA32_00990 [Candidatus Acidiferrales bacterium]|jgi:hypothetical protein